MKCLTDKRVIILALLFLLTIFVSCVPAATREPKKQPAILSPTISETEQPIQTIMPIPSPTVSETGQPTQTLTPTASPTTSETGQPTQTFAPSATHCPIPTREPFWVDPVTSPTDQLSQVIAVHIGQGEEVTIVTESGTFTVTGNTSLVEISLLPNTVHHLEVIGRVRRVPHQTWKGCIYGGYTLRTTRDRHGNPLTIVQGEPIPRQAISIITVDNAGRLEELTSFAADTGFATDFVFSKNNEVISVGNKISIWSTVTGKEVRQIGNAVSSSVAINSDGSLIAAGGIAAEAAGYENVPPWDAPTSIQLWNTVTGDMNELGLGKSHPASIAFNLGGDRLAAGNTDDSVTIWDADNQQILINFKGDVPGRLQLFSNLYWRDDDTLIAGGSEAIYWWDTTTGSLLQRLAKPAEANFFVDVAFSQNGDRVAGAAQDAYVYFWDRRIETWSRWPALFDSRITNVSFSPGGKLLVAGTDQGQFLIWNVETQQLLAHYSLVSMSIAAIRFSSDGRYIALGGWDGPIRVWGIP